MKTVDLARQIDSRKAPLANAPLAKAPLANAPLANAPLAKAPLANAPLANAPLANAPLAKAPLAKAPLAGVVVACTLCATALALAQGPSPTATYTAPAGAAAAGTGTAAAGTGAAAAGDKPSGEKAGIAVSAYAWPTETSPEPKEDEWAGATALETLDKTVKDKPWWRRETLTCTQRAVREWMRITCTPASEFTSYGVVWGAAGDLSTAKAKLPLRRDMPGYKPPENAFMTMTPAMAVSATLTFQVKRGSAAVLQVDEIEFVSDWGWSGVVARPGFVVDVSWAAGEKAPWIEVR